MRSSEIKVLRAGTKAEAVADCAFHPGRPQVYMVDADEVAGTTQTMYFWNGATLVLMIAFKATEQPGTGGETLGTPDESMTVAALTAYNGPVLDYVVLSDGGDKDRAVYDSYDTNSLPSATMIVDAAGRRYGRYNVNTILKMLLKQISLTDNPSNI